MLVQIAAARNDRGSVHCSAFGIQNRIDMRQFGRIKCDRIITLVILKTICVAR